MSTTPTTRISPVRWTPTPDPGLTGAFTKNERLRSLTIVDVNGIGPEDVAIAPNGDVWCGVEDGRIMHLSGATAATTAGGATVVCQTGGRVGGIEVVLGADGEADHLIACDYEHGLLKVSLPGGEVEVLVDRVDGERLRTTNNSAVSPDGRIWFTASSQRWDLDDFRNDLMEGRATGRLLVHDPRDGSTEVILDGLAFANGVAVTADGTAVLVANSGTFDIRRVWIDGPKRGSHDMFVEGLPCALDNLATAPDGKIWAACPIPRNKLLDLLSPKAPILRAVAARLPEWMVPAGPEVAWVLAFDPDTGEVVENLQAWGVGYGFVTGVREHDGMLWLSSLHGAGLGRISLAATR